MQGECTIVSCYRACVDLAALCLVGGVIKNWYEHAACSGVPTDEFYPTPTKPVPRLKRAPEIIQRICDMCPVTGQCLSWAFRNNEQGIWGGTTEEQRRAIMKSRLRLNCLKCESRTIVRAYRHAICLSCGVSWKEPLKTGCVDAGMPRSMHPTSGVRCLRS